MNERSEGHLTHLLAAAGLGALLMYVFDPQSGRRRVALARDQVSRLAHRTSRLTDTAMRDLRNRASGIGAGLRRMSPGAPPRNEVLEERVRATLGRWVSHPRAIDVAADAGCVRLTGDVLAGELPPLLRAVEAVRGVREVESRLQPHEAADIPSLQGGVESTGPRPEPMQRHRTPAVRLLSATGGAALAVYGMGRGGAAGRLLAIGGLLLAVGGASSRRTAAIGERTAIDIEKSVLIAAPPDKVFAMWSDYENFPRFMSHVEEVRALGEGRTHWVVEGPAGTHVEWDAVVTERIPPRLLSWRSLPGASVEHEGSVRFDEAEGGTRVTLHMSYRPPGGALGHGAAALFGRDPKREMDDDLMRMKSFVETGIPPSDAVRH
jgi:uncharacterized membrane protein